MDSSFTDRWMRKFRIITLSLIFSGALNIGLIAAFIALLIQDKERSYSVTEFRQASGGEEMTNRSILASYAHLSFRELCSLLTNTDLVEEGFAKRDLALAALVSFHDFNLEKAIGNAPAQKRMFKLDDRSIEIFPGLADEQFRAVVHYAYLERWPLTGRGLFAALQKNPAVREAELVQAFSTTPEFYAVETLFQKSGANISQDQLIGLICDGNWQMIDGFAREQSQMLDLSDDRRRHLLLSYLALQSPAAANLLLQTDFTFALKRLDDKGVLDLLARAAANETLQKFCVELMRSPRSDAVYEKSAQLLYRMANEEIPQPFDLAKARNRFALAPVVSPSQPPAALVHHARTQIADLDSARQSQVDRSKAPGSMEEHHSRLGKNDDEDRLGKVAASPNPQSVSARGIAGEVKKESAITRDAALRTHVVKEGDSLWKISRQYHVKLEDLKALNHLDKDRLKQGMILKIPAPDRAKNPSQGTGSKPPL